jgi:hypothetical protein
LAANRPILDRPLGIGRLTRKYALVQRHGQDPQPLDDEQRRHVRRRDTEDGMVKIEAVLHPEEAELVWAMLDHAATQLAREPDATARDDSAEARGALAVPGTAAISSPEHIEARGIDDSAEAREALAVPGTATPPSTGGIASWQGVDPAELAGPRAHDATTTGGCPETFSSGSVLDRLLDEADAFRDAEAVPSGDRGRSSMDPSIEPSPGRGASVLHQRADAARRAFHRADALVSLAQGYLRGDRPDRAPIEIIVTIPASSLRAGAADTVEMGETFLAAEAARRLSCDAGLVEVVEDEHGTPLSVGRKRRTIAGALKRARRRRDTACTYPGCTHRIFLEGHHVKHWADGGETSLMNTALLCSLHHRYVHEHGYAIELGPDQRPRFRDPRGRLVAAVPARPARPAPADLGWPWIRAVNAPLAIDAATIACEWDGTPVDYGAVVGYLAVADGLR